MIYADLLRRQGALLEHSHKRFEIDVCPDMVTIPRHSMGLAFLPTLGWFWGSMGRHMWHTTWSVWDMVTVLCKQ